MTEDELLKAVAAMTGDERAKLLADLVRVTERTVHGLHFRRVDRDLLCEECEHDVLVSHHDGQFEAYVHERGGEAAVLAGPFRCMSLECCVAWARGRCGLLPDQMADLMRHWRFVVSGPDGVLLLTGSSVPCPPERRIELVRMEVGGVLTVDGLRIERTV